MESLGFPTIGESTNPFEDTHRIAIVEPDEIYNVPLSVAHHCKLFIQPAHVEYVWHMVLIRMMQNSSSTQTKNLFIYIIL